jgi:hypothetical protein
VRITGDGLVGLDAALREFENAMAKVQFTATGP